MQPKTAKDAADHFMKVYKGKPITKAMIFDWWGYVMSQYPGVRYEDVETEILKRL